MEYERTPDGQIQAAFARRAGQLLLQYETISRQFPVDQQFESTLAVALLQSMLTACQDLLRRKVKKGGSLQSYDALGALASRSLFDEPALMGLESECVVECWPSRRGLTYREVFECLRNALSHPCPQGGTVYATTGFSTVDSGSGFVEAYEFVQSSWVNNSGSALGLKFAPAESDEPSKHTLEKAASDWASNHAVDGLNVKLTEQGQWRVFREGERFVPVLRLRLNVRQLRTLTHTLSDHLCAPLASAVATVA